MEINHLNIAELRALKRAVSDRIDALTAAPKKQPKDLSETTVEVPNYMNPREKVKVKVQSYAFSDKNGRHYNFVCACGKNTVLSVNFANRYGVACSDCRKERHIRNIKAAKRESNYKSFQAER